MPRIISNPAMSETMHNSTVCVQPPVTTNIQLTQFVGLIKGSKLRSPKIQIGQVHSLSDNGNVSLLWYKAPKNFLKLQLHRQQWIKDVNCLIPMSMSQDYITQITVCNPLTKPWLRPKWFRNPPAEICHFYYPRIQKLTLPEYKKLRLWHWFLLFLSTHVFVMHELKSDLLWNLPHIDKVTSRWKYTTGKMAIGLS